MIASLRNIATAQRQFREAGHADSASFAELTGVAGVRGGAPLKTPLLSTAFRPADDGSVQRGGYYYRLDRARDRWCCYAWSVEQKDSGLRTFYIDADEEILATRGYAGDLAPDPSAIHQDASWSAGG